MSALRKFLPGKKKNKKSTSSSIQSSVSEQNIAGIEQATGHKNVKEKDLPKLHKAAWSGDMVKLKQLLKKNDVNSMDRHHRTPLHYACMKGHNGITQWLCANRANLGICDEDGKAALMKAVEAASESCVEILLNHGAEANIVDVNLTTPLHIAATHGSIPLTKLLLEHGARVNALDNERITPLYLAASFNFPDLLEFLLKEYALINESDFFGRTPLIAAAMEGHDNIVKILLEYGANTEIKDKEGWKAIDHAEMTGNHSISELLKHHVHEDEGLPTENTPDNINFGSGIGSPFRSTSTQPSTFGGPAVNITADSEDDSVGNVSPQRHDLQNSWADSDSEDDDDLKKKAKVPNLTHSLKHGESTPIKSQVSKIPIATSKEVPIKKDHPDHAVGKFANKSESKIPRFDAGSKVNVTSDSEEAIALDSNLQVVNKVPKSDAGKEGSNHEATKDELKLGHGDVASKIPRLSSSSFSKRSTENLNVEVTRNEKAEQRDDKESEKYPFAYNNKSASDFESNSESLSETDILAALTGTPTKKLEKNEVNKTIGDNKPHILSASSRIEASENCVDTRERALVEEKSVEQEGVRNLVKNGNGKEIEMSNEELEWSSTTEELSTSKPNLRNLIRKDKENKTGEFDLDVDFDSSFDKSESPPRKVMETFGKAEDLNDDAKLENDKSSSSDFSLNEVVHNIDEKLSKGTSRERHNVEESKDGNKKSIKDIRAQLEALGIEGVSSLSSVSEDGSFGELNASFGKHESSIPMKEQASKSKKSDLQSENGRQVAENVSIEIDQKFGKHASPGRNQIAKMESDSREIKSAKPNSLLETASSDESSLESESEWETSLKLKKGFEKRGDDDTRQTGSNVEEIMNKKEMMTKSERESMSKNEDEVEDPKGNIDKSENVRIEYKSDSEFISDESFSVNTEGQLEELEELRLKQVDADQHFSKDFDDSDFSFSEDSEKFEIIDGDFVKLNSNDDLDIREENKEEDNSKWVLSRKNSGKDEALEVEMKKADELEEVEDVNKENTTDDFMEQVQNKVTGRTHLPGSQMERDEELDREVTDSEIKDMQKKEADEKTEYLQNIVNNMENIGGANRSERIEPENVELYQKRSDGNKKESSEVVLTHIEPSIIQALESENHMTPASMESIESEVNVTMTPVLKQKQPRAQIENSAGHGDASEHKVLDELEDIEEEFERKLKEKEMESEKQPLQFEKEGIRSLPKEEFFSDEMEILKETKNDHAHQKWLEMEEPTQGETARIDLERKKLRDSLDLETKRHLEELMQKERNFENELLRKEVDEKKRREQLRAERQMERKKLEEVQIKEGENVEMEIANTERNRRAMGDRRKKEGVGKEEKELLGKEKERKPLDNMKMKNAEEELKRVEKEKEVWERKKGKILERKEIVELEEAEKRIKQGELEAAGNLRSTMPKELEELPTKIKNENIASQFHDSRRNELEELIAIEQFMREQEEEEKNRVIKSVLNEDIVQGFRPNVVDAARCFVQEDTSAVETANQIIEHEVQLKSPDKKLSAQVLPEIKYLDKAEDSGKMRQESDLVLELAVDKSKELLGMEKKKNKSTAEAYVRASPRHRERSNDELSDYGSADIDEITKANSYAHHREDIYSAIHTPGSDVVDAPSYQPVKAVDYHPIASTPLGRYDDSRLVGYVDSISPLARPQSAPFIMDRNDTIAVSTPMALYTSLSQTGHFQDSKALMKMQDALKESKREGERLKEKNVVLENVKQEMETDLREMQRTIEVLSRSQTDFEKLRLDMEMEIRDVKYRLDSENQSRISAERLTSQLKEQIKKGDEKLARESEARQVVELAYKTLESEFRKRENIINQFESEANDLRFSLYHEREARINQEQLYKDQLQQHEFLLEETQKTSLQHAQALNQLEITDQNRQSAESSVDQLKIDLAKTKGELTRVNAQLEDVKSTYESEVSRLRNKLQDTMDNLVKSEREQFQIQMQIEAEKSTAKAEQLRLAASLENEIANSNRLQTELNVFKTQMQNANSELERVTKTKVLSDSEVNKFKEESNRDRSKHDRELANTKDELQLQRANVAFTEKSGQLVMSHRELDYKTSLLSQMEEKFRHEKELNQKLASKLDNGSERSSVLQREIDNLRRELETANQRTVDCDKAARDAQGKFQELLAKAKEDFEKEKYNLEQRIFQLSESASRYQEERGVDREEVKSKENEIRLIQKELNDLVRAVSAAEAAKEIQTKKNERLEQDNSKLSKQAAILEKELKEMTSMKNDLEKRVEDLSEKLEHLLKVSDHTSIKLVERDNDVQNVKLSKAELEKAVTRLKVEKAELSSELREETAKSQMILDDLRRSNDARESLEKILANLKTTNFHLEEKLQSETLTRAQHERNAEEHKDLWSSEVKSKSRLGLQLISMEKEIQKLKAELDAEQRKVMNVEELKRNLESKLDDYDKRFAQQRKESNALKTKLKQYQRRIKDVEAGERRIPKIYNDFEREKDVMMNNNSNLRRQVDSLIDQLKQEQEYRSKAETNSKRNDQELLDLRTKEKILSFEKAKLERENGLLEEELDKLKNFYELNYIDRSSLEAFKRDVETKARLEINKKLQDVNIELEEQATAREAYDRLRNETESKCKKELESTINNLKNELSFVKSALQEGIIKNGTYETEANRIRELYRHEIEEKQKLAEKVEKLNDQSVRLNSTERSRKGYQRGASPNGGNTLYLSAERDEHPSAPALRHSAVGSFVLPVDRGNSSPRNYLPAHRRTYRT